MALSCGRPYGRQDSEEALTRRDRGGNELNPVD